jgi:uncharacterized protein
MLLGIKSITVEIGNPQIIQKRYIKNALFGVSQIMSFLKMTAFDLEQTTTLPVICSHSEWLHTDIGGLLTVIPETNTVKFLNF